MEALDLSSSAETLYFDLIVNPIVNSDPIVNLIFVVRSGAGEGDGINLSISLTEQNFKNTFQKKLFKCAVIPIVCIFLNNKLGKF